MTSLHHNPDDRELLDFADAINAGEQIKPESELEQTYVQVNRVMRAEADAMPADLKQSTWEDVMTTLAISPARPVSNRTRRSEAPKRHARRNGWNRMRWTPLASIAAAVLVMLASVGVWRVATLDGDSPTPPPDRQVAGISTAPQGLLQVAATPDATAVEDGANGSIPIFTNVDAQPIDGPVIWITTTGDLLYDDGLGEVKTIATGVQSVMPDAPGVIIYTTLTPDGDLNRNNEPIDDYVNVFYNLSSGKSLEMDESFSSYLGEPNAFGGPLQVTTVTNAPNEWSIVNFETMESASISELTGGIFRSSDSINVSVAKDGSTVAVASSSYQSEASAILSQQSGLPGTIAVIPADLSGVTWVNLPEGMPAVGNMRLSPDGSTIALISSNSSETGQSMMVSLIDVATDTEILRTELVEAPSTILFQWVDQGPAFTLVGGHQVLKYAPDSAEPAVVFETEGIITQMPQMGIPNVMHLQVVTGEVGAPVVPESTQFVILNVETGKAVTIDGSPWFIGISMPEQLTVGLSPIPVSQDGKTAKLYHPVTGEEIAGVEADVYDPMKDPSVTPDISQGMQIHQPVTVAYDAPVSVVWLTDGNLAKVTLSDTSYDVEVIEVPVEVQRTQVFLAPLGDYLVVDISWDISSPSTPMMLDLTDEAAEWTPLDPTMPTTFVMPAEAP